MKIQVEHHSLSEASTSDEEPDLIQTLPPSHLRVLLYIPNIIDYLRYLLVLKAIHHSFISSEW